MIGQQRAKKMLAVAVHNHYKRLRAKRQRQQGHTPSLASLPSDNFERGPTGAMQVSKDTPAHAQQQQQQQHKVLAAGGLAALTRCMWLLLLRT